MKATVAAWRAARARTLSAVTPQFTRLPGRPFGAVATADGSAVFVSLPAPDASVVAVLGPGDPWRVVGVVPIPPPGKPRGMCLDASGRFLLVADGDGITVIDVTRALAGAEDAVTAVVRTRDESTVQVVLEQEQRFAFVTNETSDSLSVFDFDATLRSGTPAARLVGRVRLPPAPVGIALSRDGERLFVTSQKAPDGGKSGALSTLSVREAAEDPERVSVTSVPAGRTPVRVAVSPAGGTVWLTARASNELLAFDAEGLAQGRAAGPRAAVRVGRAPVGLAFAGAGSLIVVANSNRYDAPDREQTLSVVDAEAALAGKRALVGTIPAGAFPREVTVLPDDETLLVTNVSSKTLETVSIAPLLDNTPSR